MVVGVLAGILSGLRTPSYRATAHVLLRPNDPTEQLNPTNAGQIVANDPERYVAGQETIVASAAVAAEAAKTLRGISAKDVQRRVGVSQEGQSNVLNISAGDPDAVRARDIANAVAKGYIENRRQAAVSGLQQAAKDIENKLGPLQASIASLDTQIGDAPAVPGASSQLVTPTAPGSSVPPAGPVAPAGQSAGAGGQATTAEALKAQRYAAAVQFETLFARQQELLVNISLKRGEAELIGDAETPTKPVSPRPKRDAVLGMFAGLLLAVGATFVREQFDDQVRSVDEVQQITGLPLLGRLPLDDEVARATGGVAVVDQPNSPLAEAIRSLRTSIQYLGADEPVKLIVVTSSVPGEGKSLVASNLAASFAQADYRTLLVGADLRRASINELFGKHPYSPGLTGIIAPMAATGESAGSNGNGRGMPALQSTKDSAGAVVRTPVRNLLLLPSGPTPPNPAELLGSRRMTGFLAEWGATADVVILDTPPLLAVTDAAVLAANCDGVVLVTAVDETRRDALKSAKTILDGTGARLLGVVANKVPSSGSGAYYYGGYYGASPDGPSKASMASRLRGLLRRDPAGRG